jgi:hypothetical protein
MRCLSAIRTNGRPGPVEVYGRMVRKLPLCAVKAISCSQRNDSYGAHSGRSQGDPWRQASRPTEVSTAAVCYVRSTSIRDIAPSLKCAKSGHSRASASGPMYLLLDSSTGYDLQPRRQRRSFGGGEYQGYARRRKEAARPWSSRGDQLPAFVSSLRRSSCWRAREIQAARVPRRPAEPSILDRNLFPGHESTPSPCATTEIQTNATESVTAVG